MICLKLTSQIVVLNVIRCSLNSSKSQNPLDFTSKCQIRRMKEGEEVAAGGQ
jgi:hypothetical protein